MSDFLVNLARRSAGLASVVRARPAPAAMAIDVPYQTPAIDALRGAAPAAPLAIAPTLAPVAPHAPIAVKSAARERAVTHATARPAREPAAPRRSERSEDAIAPAIVPAAVLRIDPLNESGHEERGREIVREGARVIDRVIEPAASNAAAPVVVTVQPAERAAPATPAPHAEPTPERTVHVRIGAIEIYGADTGASAQMQAAIAPVAPAMPASPVLPAGGFDDYAALRSYAPWAW